jgi:hypothetical protein
MFFLFVFLLVINFLTVKMDDFWESNRTKQEFIWKTTGLYAMAGTIVEIEIKLELLNVIKVHLLIIKSFPFVYRKESVLIF